MREVKRLCDPRGVLNPGVVLTDDADAHLQAPQAPPTGRVRGRPVRGVRLLRAGLPEPRPHHHPAAADRAAPGDAARPRPRATRRWSRSSRTTTSYDGVDTCAVDGMCQTACPVLINTGDLVKRLRAGERRRPRRRAGQRPPSTGRAPPGRHRWPSTSPPCCRRRWSPGATALGRKVIDAGRAARVVAGPAPRRVPAHGGPTPDEAATRCIFAVVHRHDVRARRRRRGCHRRVRRSCASGRRDHPDLAGRAAVAVLRHAVEVQGHAPRLEAMAARVLPALWAATREGELPVVVRRVVVHRGAAADAGDGGRAVRQDPRGGRGGVRGGDACCPG